MRVCVLGMHQSGFGLIAQLLRAGGLRIQEPAEGPLWDKGIAARLNIEVLNTLNSSWHHPPTRSAGWDARKALADLDNELHLGALPSGWADAQTMLTLRWWYSIVPDLQVVLCLRNPLETAILLSREAFRGELFTIEEALALTQQYYTSFLEDVKQDQLIVTHYEAYLYDPAAELGRVFAQLGQEPNTQQIQRALELFRFPEDDVHLSDVTAWEDNTIPEQLQTIYTSFLERAGEVYAQSQVDTEFWLAKLQKYVNRFTIEQAELRVALNVRIKEQQDALQRLEDRHQRELETLQAQHKQEVARLWERKQAEAGDRNHTNGMAATMPQSIANQAVDEQSVEDEAIETLKQKHKAAIRQLQYRYLTEQSRYESKISALQQDYEMLAQQHAHMQWAAQHYESRLIETLNRLHTVTGSRAWRYIDQWWQLRNRLRSALGGTTAPATLPAPTHERPTAPPEARTATPAPSPSTSGEMSKDQVLNTSVPTINRNLGERDFLIFPIADPGADPRYIHHMRMVEPTEQQLYQQMIEVYAWEDTPIMSIVTPVYKPPLDIFQETVLSVRTQTYEFWEWLVVDASPDETIWTYLQELAAEDPRIKPIRAIENEGISANTNIGLKAATGDYIVLLDHDDTLVPHALYEVAKVARLRSSPDMIYSDEDKLDEHGFRCEPIFKPSWSPDMMLCVNMVTHLAAFKRSLLDQIGYMNPETDGAQDWDIFLRIGEVTSNIHHIPKILYNWRKSISSTAQATGNKPGIQRAQKKAVMNHLERLGLKDPEVHFIPDHPMHGTFPMSTWKQHNLRKISIIIPSLEHANIVSDCLNSIFDLTTYEDFEVILVDTGSKMQETFDVYARYEDDARFQVVDYREKFNFSKACNFGANYASGELLLFLNNDTIVLQPDWLDLMAQWFERDGVGMVGPKLLYPNGTVQHAGVIVGMGGLASHLFIQQPENIVSIFGTDAWYRNLMSVTGACLMISREALNAVGGWDEEYLLNYSDVELGIQVYQAGYRVVYTPHVRLIHRESVTHSSRIPRVDFERATNQWMRWLQRGDPFFNPNFSYASAYPIFKIGPHDTPFVRNYELMSGIPDKEIITLPDDWDATIQAKREEAARNRWKQFTASANAEEQELSEIME